MKPPLYKKASLGFLAPKKAGIAKPMKKAMSTMKAGAVKSAKSLSWKNPKYKPSNGKGVSY